MSLFRAMVVSLVLASPVFMSSVGKATSESPLKSYELARHHHRHHHETKVPARRCLYPSEAIDIPGSAPNKLISLTFDDGPHPETTAKILDILKKEKISATFFLIGENIVGNEALVDRIIREGHNIGNHSFTHPNFHDIDVHQANEELTKTEDLLREFRLRHVYRLHGRKRVMRFPYGESTCDGEAIAESFGYTVVGWDIDTCDWNFGESEVEGHSGATSACIEDADLLHKYGQDFLGWIDSQLVIESGGVMLLHDRYPYTVSHLEELIHHLRDEGYRFEPLDRGDFPELFPEKNARPSSFKPRP